jgi:hypothetical protein
MSASTAVFAQLDHQAAKAIAAALTVTTHRQIIPLISLHN